MKEIFYKKTKMEKSFDFCKNICLFVYSLRKLTHSAEEIALNDANPSTEEKKGINLSLRFKRKHNIENLNKTQE